MGFSQATITDLEIGPSNGELLVSWSSTSPAGTAYQVYVAGNLAWYGTATSVVLPWPTDYGRATSIVVGTVDAADYDTDFSSSITLPSNRVDLAWLGGTYLDPDIQGFLVYSSDVAGGAVDLTTPIATVPAYPGGIILDGFGLGGFGQAGFGCSASSYSHTTGPLGNGTWNFEVKVFDRAGNVSAGLATSATIAAPPNPPAPNANGIRLTYTYNPSTHVATLNWLASPP